MANEDLPNRRCLACGRRVDNMMADRPGLVPNGFWLTYVPSTPGAEPVEVCDMDECDVPSCPCIGPDAERDWFAPLRPDFMHMGLDDFEF